MKRIYDFKALNNKGIETDLSQYKGLKAKATHKMLKTLSKSVEKESDILWNFTKFLINRDCSIVKRYAPVATPQDMEKDIVEML